MPLALAGATGRLRPLIPMLLERGHRVRVLTRDAASPIANDLRRRDAEIRRVDFDEPRSWERLKTPKRAG
jgi:uncharacterized protein YbjT (DUF2867 family)